MGSSEVTDCPKTYPVKDYLSHCEDVCQELGSSKISGVSTVYIAGAYVLYVALSYCPLVLLQRGLESRCSNCSCTSLTPQPFAKRRRKPRSGSLLGMLAEFDQTGAGFTIDFYCRLMFLYNAQAEVAKDVGIVATGQVWFPRQEIVLGPDGACDVLDILHKTRRSVFLCACGVGAVSVRVSVLLDVVRLVLLSLFLFRISPLLVSASLPHRCLSLRLRLSVSFPFPALLQFLCRCAVSFPVPSVPGSQGQVAWRLGGRRLAVGLGSRLVLGVDVFQAGLWR